jgi:hypothetical protein
MVEWVGRNLFVFVEGPEPAACMSFGGFCQPLADFGAVRYVKPRQIPYTAFPLNYGQIILSFDVY